MYFWGSNHACARELRAHAGSKQFVRHDRARQLRRVNAIFPFFPFFLKELSFHNRDVGEIRAHAGVNGIDRTVARGRRL